MEAWNKAFTKATGIHLDGGHYLVCGNCQLVCAGIDIKESQKRYKMLAKSGFVIYDKDREVVHTHDYDEAVALQKANPWRYQPKTWLQHPITLLKLLLPKWGIDWHGMTRIGAYNRKLEKAIAEQVIPKVNPKDREAAIESMDREINKPELEFVVAEEETQPEMVPGD